MTGQTGQVELERVLEMVRQLEKRVEKLGERLDRLEAERIKVSYPQIQMCNCWIWGSAMFCPIHSSFICAQSQQLGRPVDSFPK